MEYYVAVKKNEGLHVWIEDFLKDIPLSEKIVVKNIIYGLLPYKSKGNDSGAQLPGFKSQHLPFTTCVISIVI